MKIRDGIKLGIGLYVVYVFKTVADCCLTPVANRWLANDDEYMADLKNRRPYSYRNLLKYRTKEEEP